MFKTSDLRTGMTVEIKDGRYVKVIKGAEQHPEGMLVAEDGTCLVELGKFNANLIYENYTINNVWAAPSYMDGLLNFMEIDITTYQLFERAKEVFLTIDQIEEYLGIQNLRIIK